MGNPQVAKELERSFVIVLGTQLWVQRQRMILDEYLLRIGAGPEALHSYLEV